LLQHAGAQKSWDNISLKARELLVGQLLGLIRCSSSMLAKVDHLDCRRLSFTFPLQSTMASDQSFLSNKAVENYTSTAFLEC
jgi:hypothetical protein